MRSARDKSRAHVRMSTTPAACLRDDVQGGLGLDAGRRRALEGGLGAQDVLALFFGLADEALEEAVPGGDGVLGLLGAEADEGGQVGRDVGEAAGALGGRDEKLVLHGVQSALGADLRAAEDAGLGQRADVVDEVGGGAGLAMRRQEEEA